MAGDLLLSIMGRNDRAQEQTDSSRCSVGGRAGNNSTTRRGSALPPASNHHVICCNFHVASRSVSSISSCYHCDSSREIFVSSQKLLKVLDLTETLTVFENFALCTTLLKTEPTVQILYVSDSGPVALYCKSMTLLGSLTSNVQWRSVTPLTKTT